MMSLWTGTPMFAPRRGELLIQTLAICLARRAFAELEFVTDKTGAEIAERLGWKFSRVSTALDAMPSHGLQHIWALGKFAALLDATEDGAPVCQLDGDVLLFSALPEPLLRAPLLAQSPDPEHFYRGPEMERGFALTELPINQPKWNGGLLGGADVPLLRAYAYASLDLARRFRDDGLNGTATSMIIEQAHLGVFARRCQVEVGTLFRQAPAAAVYSHYGHLSGSEKRNPMLVARYRQQLRTQFPEAAERFEAGWPEVQRRFPDAERTRPVLTTSSYQ